MFLGLVLASNRKAAIAAALGCAAVLPSYAADGERPPGEGPKMQLEVSSSVLPRFDAEHTRDSRVDFLILPVRRSAVGLSFGLNQKNASGTNLPFVPGLGGTSVDLGVHWRYTLDSNYRVDITAWRRVPADAIALVESREPSYGARVEMPMSPARLSHGFVADKGFVGFQLEGGGRITVKRSGGKPMLYYRNTF